MTELTVISPDTAIISWPLTVTFSPASNKGTVNGVPVHLHPLLSILFLALPLHGQYEEDHIGLSWKQSQRRKEEWKGETGLRKEFFESFYLSSSEDCLAPLFSSFWISEVSKVQDGQTGIWKKKQAMGKPEKNRIFISKIIKKLIRNSHKPWFWSLYSSVYQRVVHCSSLKKEK